MRTALIRVCPPTERERGYPVRLFFDGSGEGWLDRPLATDAIPESLSPPAPPQIGDGPGTPESIRRFLLEQDQPSPLFAEIGAYLYGLVARGAVEGELQRLAAKYPGRAPADEGLRVLVEIDAAELRLLPWELMRSDGPMPLFADERNPWTRVQRFDFARPPSPRAPVLRLLVVVGADPEDEVVQSEREVAGLREALRGVWGLVDFEVLDRPTQSQLEARYRQLKPHVFHFIGHGIVGENGPELEIAPRGDQDGWAWTTTAIRTDLQSWQPRLVILNACRSIELSEQEGVWQIADAFAQLRVPAVLGMQADVRGDAAAAFAGALYAALADDLPLDIALSRARVAMSHVVSWDERDPYLPCLTLSMPPECVMPSRFAMKDDDLRRRIQKTADFVNATRFVDRSVERRQLWQTVAGDDIALAEPGVLAVTGDAQVGKTELVRWCVASVSLTGANVAYVDLRQNGSLDFRAVLSAVAQQLIGSPVHGDRNRAAFEAFVVKLAASQFEAEDAIETVFDDFHECLRTAAAAGPLVLALDHVDAVEPAHWTTYVAKHLLQPVAEGALPLELIVVVDRTRVDDALAPDLRSIVSMIDVVELPQEQYEELARLYLRLRGFKPIDFDEIVTVLAAKVPPLWNTNQFRLLDQIARELRWQREQA